MTQALYSGPELRNVGLSTDQTNIEQSDNVKADEDDNYTVKRSNSLQSPDNH